MNKNNPNSVVKDGSGLNYLFYLYQKLNSYILHELNTVYIYI